MTPGRHTVMIRVVGPGGQADSDALTLDVSVSAPAKATNLAVK
jgi:hypothetical protein